MTRSGFAFFHSPPQATVVWPRRSFQRGGTLVGFILGVLVGLAGALAVAVYVTKVPVPFVDRVISRKTSDDVAEAERNKNWDPNAALQGKSVKPPPAEVPAPGDVVVAPSVPSPAAVMTPPVVTPPAKKVVVESATPAAPVPAPAPAVAAKPKAVSPVSSDPLGDLATSKAQGKSVAAASPAAAVPVGADPVVYFVQVGAYKTPEDAQAQRAKLVLMGLDAKISEREQAGRTVYRVRLGPYDRQLDADKMKDSLGSNGFDAALVRVQR
jgi:cell division protein FtsN